MKNQQRLEAWHKKKAGGYALIPGNSRYLGCLPPRRERWAVARLVV